MKSSEEESENRVGKHTTGKQIDEALSDACLSRRWGNQSANHKDNNNSSSSLSSNNSHSNLVYCATHAQPKKAKRNENWPKKKIV